MRLCRLTILSLLGMVLVVPLAAKDNELTLVWPPSGPTNLKLAFGKFRETSSYGGQRDYASDVTVQNVSGKNITFASFTVYILDKAGVRIGDTVLQVKDLGPGQQVKEPLQFHTTGQPASVNLVARNDASGIPLSLKTIPMKIISVPDGAKLKIDGQEAGVTPYLARLRPGSHILEFSKEGYAAGSTPLEIAPDELPGGSITFELGGLSRDTVELRDGTVLLGDVLSMSMTEVKVRVAGQDQTYDRNRVKKIMLVEREVVREPALTQPADDKKP
jgi:hypothetical protein